MIVYRVQQCACCTEMEEMEEEPVVLVNLLLMRPCTQRAGTVWKLPECDLAVTMEIQVCAPLPEIKKFKASQKPERFRPPVKHSRIELPHSVDAQAHSLRG